MICVGPIAHAGKQNVLYYYCHYSTLTVLYHISGYCELLSVFGELFASHGIYYTKTCQMNNATAHKIVIEVLLWMAVTFILLPLLSASTYTYY